MKDKQRSTSQVKDKHTPGPWIVAEDQVGDNDGNVIADVTKYNEWNTTEGIVTNEMPWEANARLMAAAPEMLEMIKEMTELLYEIGERLDNELVSESLMRIVKRSRSYVARIEGDE